jgi:sulfate permease, SulP family
MTDDDFSLSIATFKYLVLNMHNLILWLPAFGLAVLLRIITHKWNHQLIFPLCTSSPLVHIHQLTSRLDFITIPIIFYIIVSAAGLDLGSLRRDGWLFEVNDADEPWYKFYGFYGA